LGKGLGAWGEAVERGDAPVEAPDWSPPTKRLDMKSLMTVAALLLPLLGTAVGQTREAEALRVLDDFMVAFNNQDFEGMAAVYHYPHVRIGDGRVSVWETAEEFTAPEGRGGLQGLLKATGWHRSAWASREVLQSSADKVHIVGRSTRYREDDSLIGTYDSLWIVTKRDGRWGVQARSSFAAKDDGGSDAIVQNRDVKVGGSAAAEMEGNAQEVPCAWFEWRTLMERFPPTPEGAEITKAKRKKGSIRQPQTKVTHRIRGVWIVEAVVDETGKVQDARIKATPEIDPPWPGMERAIIKSIRGWRFEPARTNGQPRPACTTVTIVDE
jgi:hypothetical protein